MGIYSKTIDLQKLNQAWEKVRVKKATPGMDGVTVDMFTADYMEQLKKLNLELKLRSYEPMPVSTVTLHKGEKDREVSLFCLRDKIVQQSLANELHKMYDHTFAQESYAFHSRRSALDAVSRVEAAVKNQGSCWVLKTDIHHFFDEIDHRKLLEILQIRVTEQEVLDLVYRFLTVQALDDAGELKEKTRGIYQGSTIAPLLSNIYLNAFDHQIREDCQIYCRYADDILCIDPEKEKIEQTFQTIRQVLGELGLQINEAKTTICQVADGFEYLGYAFSAQGKGVPAKKEASLKERLEELWFQEMPFEEKAEKGLQIITGWLQYYRGPRKIESLQELVLEIYRQKAGKEFKNQFDKILVEKVYAARKQFSNVYPDICQFLASFWTAFDMTEAVLIEYEDFWQIRELDKERMTRIQDEERRQLVRQYELLMIAQEKETLENLMQLYMDAHCFNKASAFDEKIKSLERGRSLLGSSPNASSKAAASGDIDYTFNEEEIQTYYQYFVGREDIYARESVNQYGKRCYELVKEPFRIEVLEQGFQQGNPMATYVQRSNGTVHYMVFDLDVSKKILLQYAFDTEEFQAYLKVAWKKCIILRKILVQMGLEPLIEYSGFRGYHMWVLFSEWISVRFIHLLSERIVEKLEKEIRQLTNRETEEEMDRLISEKMQDITVEIFPNKTKIRDDKPGQCLRLPLTQNIRSGRRSQFLDTEGVPYIKQSDVLDQLSAYNLLTVKRVIAMTGGQDYQKMSGKNYQMTPGQNYQMAPGQNYQMASGQNGQMEPGQNNQITPDLCDKAESAFGNIEYGEKIAAGDSGQQANMGNGSRNIDMRTGYERPAITDLYPDMKQMIRIVLEKCSLMEYLCRKAHTTGYLTHFERQTIVYVFGHMGDTGKEFVHEVMKHTLNYNYSVTQKFVTRLPQKPISCVKLREQYKQITAEAGCNCRFQRTKNCYPSPVLHAVKDYEDTEQEITLPLSRDISQTKEKQVYEEINIHKKAQNLAAKLLELKKQKRGIDKNVKKLEEELTDLFNSASIDSMEIEMGLLVRRRKGEGYEWVIEL